MGKLPALLPADPGTYVILLRLANSRSMVIGQLGCIDFRPGWYTYVGSAMGSGGIAARVRRHYRLRKKTYWHIDYLRSSTRMEGFFFVVDRLRLEHALARRIGADPLAGHPVARFGATDCRCESHLFYFPQCPEPAVMASTLDARWIPLALRRQKSMIPT